MIAYMFQPLINFGIDIPLQTIESELPLKPVFYLDCC